MQAVKTIRGVAMPLNRADVDTDQIIPAKYLKLVERTGFGRFIQVFRVSIFQPCVPELWQVPPVLSKP
jgi:3-isopropylmalate dehydratase small subunit